MSSQSALASQARGQYLFALAGFSTGHSTMGHTECQRSIEAIKRYVNSLDTDLFNAQQNIIGLVARNQQQQIHVANIVNQYDAAANQINAVYAELQERTEDANDIDNHIAELTKSNEYLAMKIDELTNENSKLRVSATSAVEDARNQFKCYRLATNKVRVLNNEITQLSSQLATAKRERDAALSKQPPSKRPRLAAKRTIPIVDMPTKREM
jgi:DNA repair exonuclease SbcCD ATPase subunit